MKNLLISLIIACVVFTSFVSTASAEPTFEKADNVVSMVIQVTKMSKSGKVMMTKKYCPLDAYKCEQLQKPITTLLKPCATDNGSSRICLYEIKGNKEIRIFDYDYSDRDHSIVVYQFATKPKTASR